jgi:hypothetical protein
MQTFVGSIRTTIVKALSLVLASFIGSSTCTASDTIGHDRKDNAATSVRVPSHILVLTPKLTFERSDNESPIDGERYRAAELSAKIASLSQACLREKAVPTVELVGSQRPSVAQIVEMANRAFSATPDPKLVGLIRGLGSAGEPTAVLVQYIRVKVDVSASWNPTFGAMAILARTSYSQLRAALFDSRTGQMIWRNAVEMREVLVPNSGTLEKTVRELLSTIHTH